MPVLRGVSWETGLVSAGPESLLSRRLYSFGEAARLLGLNASKLRRWVDGAVVAGRRYEPVIRAASTGEPLLSWGEFVEAGFLREYRARGVSLQQLRPTISALRLRFDTEYPFATHPPFIGEGRRLVLEVQQETGIDERLYVVVSRGVGQYVLSPVAEAFLDKVEFDPQWEIARRMRPLGASSPVVIDPERSFGQPTVRGVRTETIAELFLANESVSDIAEGYDLTEIEVQAALRWELTDRAA